MSHVVILFPSNSNCILAFKVDNITTEKKVIVFFLNKPKEFSMWTVMIYFSFITQKKHNESAMSNTFPVISEAPPPEPLPPAVLLPGARVVDDTAVGGGSSQKPRKENIRVA